MSFSQTEQAVARLRQIYVASPVIEASTVVLVNLLIIDLALPNDVKEDRVTTMSAALPISDATSLIANPR